MKHIRNFCIIAHIDHGKSTLADRLLEMTKTVEDREMKAQLLDQMDLERERGITIKLQPVRMHYTYQGQEYILNLIDTPGHVDFTYEVSRSLQACEGALLLVDASQGIEAQTMANATLAQEQGLKIIPVVNKIDLPAARPEEAAQELKSVFGFQDNEILYASGKTGQGVADILAAVIERIPQPHGEQSSDARALIFDSTYDPHRGVVVYLRVVDGELLPNKSIYMLQEQTEGTAIELGYFTPKMKKSTTLKTGEVGYVVTGLRDTAKAKVGDTVTQTKNIEKVQPLPGYKEILPVVYAGVFPVSGDDYPKLRDAMGKLKLSDSSLIYEPESVPSLGFGFRCGFLGLLHMEIVQERLRREYDLDLVLTAPSVAYNIELTDNSQITIHNPAEFPEVSKIRTIFEPWAKLEILAPANFMGPIMELVTSRHGISVDVNFVSQERIKMLFEMPLQNIIIDFYDKLKSISSGFASLNYEFVRWMAGDLVKVDILIAGEKVDSLALIARRQTAASDGRMLIERLKNLIPKAQFEIALQATIGGKVIARESISALRKDVTGYLYGGDVTRKMKLLNKQKKGKKRMKQIGKVNIPQEAFLAILQK